MKFIIIQIFFFTTLFSQEKNLITIQAENLVGKTIGDENVREWQGNVYLTQGNIKLWCDNAIQYLSKNEVEVFGNVRVVRDTITLTAQRGRYYGNTKFADCEKNVKLQTKNITLTADFGKYFLEERRAEFRQNVRIIDSSTTIFCDELTYFEKERKSIAIKNVKMQNVKDNITVFGNYLEHYDAAHYTKITQQPKLVQIDTTTKEKDTLFVQSTTMESFGDTLKKLVAQDSVVLIRGKLTAQCGMLSYIMKNDSIELQNNPIVWFDDNQITGDTISLQLQKKKLRTAYIRGHAFAVSSSNSQYQSRYNQLTGKNIILDFENNTLQKISVFQNAISLYFLYEDITPNGANKTTGDIISMKLKEGKPETIHILRGVEGTYYPENLIRTKIQEYNLDGFVLYNNRPTKQ